MFSCRQANVDVAGKCGVQVWQVQAAWHHDSLGAMVDGLESCIPKGSSVNI